MKEPFEKITLLTWHGDRERITEALQELGVVHLAGEEVSGAQTEQLEQERRGVEQALEAIGHASLPDKGRKADKPAREVVQEILELKHTRDACQQKLEALDKDRLRSTPWGLYDPDKLQRLEEQGIRVSFWVAPQKTFRHLDLADLATTVLHRADGQVYFVTVTTGEPPSLPCERVEVPRMPLPAVLQRREDLQQQQQQIDEKLQALAPYGSRLERYRDEVMDRVEFSRATAHFSAPGKGSIPVLSGWFPVSEKQRITQWVEEEGLAYHFSEATPADQVPVMLKNQKFPRLFEPITKIFELPGYYELDLTPFIAVFYPILFAYCLGDAGYGLVLLVAAAVGAFTFLKTMKGVALLGMILGAFTMLMGIVKSGSVFGIPVVSETPNPVFRFLAQYVIIPDDTSFIFNAFNVALMIGVVQILTGIVLSIANKLRYAGPVQALPQVGKLMIVGALLWIFLADMQGMEAFQPLAAVRKALLFTGIGLVAFFHDMTLPVFRRVAGGLLPLFFIFTGILGDILSYVRLFALGVASSVLGLVVNQIGMQIMENGWWGVVVGGVFLLFGHSLNFFIAVLGAFVHPLRLTFVEFYNNAQFQGGGVAYRPFKKLVQD